MTILIVDDQPNLARVTAVALRMLECRTHVAATLGEATRILAAEKIDAVFLDVNLGEENGFDFLPVLSAQFKHLPVVMFSAQTRDEVAAEALQRGAFDCMVKPFDLDDLRLQLARIEEHLNRQTPPSVLDENPTPS